jgi:hypothetical protein
MRTLQHPRLYDTTSVPHQIPFNLELPKAFDRRPKEAHVPKRSSTHRNVCPREAKTVDFRRELTRD